MKKILTIILLLAFTNVFADAIPRDEWIPPSSWRQRP